MDEFLLAALKAIADPERLRVAGRLAGGPARLGPLAAELGLPPRVVLGHLGQLVAAGLARADGAPPDAEYALDREGLLEVGRRIGGLERRPRGDAAAGDAADEDAKVLRAFVVDGRLVSIPAQEKKKLPVLRYLMARCFAEARVYPEKEVNMRLALLHPDVASLRRYLVDYGYLTRDHGDYRRTDPQPAP